MVDPTRGRRSAPARMIDVVFEQIENFDIKWIKPASGSR